MAASNTYVTLPSGQKFPIFGLGTWKSKPNEVKEAVKAAIDAGYRHIDGAWIYGNEDELGDALQEKMNDGTIKREDIFITSKLWNTYHREEDVRKNLEDSLKKLKLEYVDLYLIHWPTGFESGDNSFPTNPDGSLRYDDYDFVQTWQAMEKLVGAGLAKNVGVSNFNISQVQRILDLPNTVPIANNQVELHPYLPQDELVNFCKSKGISVTAYSPLGSPDNPFPLPDAPSLLKDPIVNKIAQTHGVGPGVILIRYQIERGIVVIPKSVNPSRIAENIKALSVRLTAQDMQQLATINRGFRFLPFPPIIQHKFYPF